jgi:predicted transcriptional regulator
MTEASSEITLSEKPCPYCEELFIDGADFCHHCGGRIEEKSAEALLEIKIEPKDIRDLVISGYVEKEIPISKELVLTIRTMTMAESVKAKLDTDRIVDGSLVSDDTYASIKSQEDIKYILREINGKPVPATVSPTIVGIAIQKAYLLQVAMNQKVQEGKIQDF